jgi:hypothetical protein
MNNLKKMLLRNCLDKKIGCIKNKFLYSCFLKKTISNKEFFMIKKIDSTQTFFLEKQEIKKNQPKSRFIILNEKALKKTMKGCFESRVFEHCDSNACPRDTMCGSID